MMVDRIALLGSVIQIQPQNKPFKFAFFCFKLMGICKIAQIHSNRSMYEFVIKKCPYSYSPRLTNFSSFKSRYKSRGLVLRCGSLRYGRENPIVFTTKKDLKNDPANSTCFPPFYVSLKPSLTFQACSSTSTARPGYCPRMGWSQLRRTVSLTLPGGLLRLWGRVRRLYMVTFLVNK